MTYGQLKFRLTQMFPGLSLDLIEGWANDRYTEILGELPWSRLNVQARLVTVAPYSVGTAAVVGGSTAVVGLGTTWATGMTGRAFRIAARSEFYEFTWLTATTGTLDRPYEGPDAPLAGYSIFQNVYPLPVDCRMLQDHAFSNAYGDLQRFTHAELNETDPSRIETGTPIAWCSYMDDSSTPPRMQVELWPIPNTAIGLPFSYLGDASPLTATSTILQVWMQPTALVEGIVAKIKRHLKDYAGAQLASIDAKNALANMRTSEAQGMAPAQMKLDDYYTAHRRKRYSR
jgi:hypothetical protein